MRAGFTTVSKMLPVLAALALSLVALGGNPAAAALPAPQWLPGQPMLAGPQVIAMWMPVIGATKYVVYLNGQKLMDSPANQYIGPAPEKAGVYNYEITAVDGAGAEGAKSAPGTISIVKLEPPSLPMAREDAENKAANIRWNTVKGAVSYDVFRASAQEGPWNLLSSLQDVNYKDSNLEYDTDYYYSVIAKDVSGKTSDRSPALKLRMKKPTAAVKQVQYKLQIVGMTPATPIDFFGTVPTKGNLIDFFRGPDDRIWAIFPAFFLQLGEDLQPQTAYVLDPAFRFGAEGDPPPPFKVVNIPPPEGLPKAMKILGYNFIDSAVVLLSDEANGLLLKLDLDAAEYIWRSKPIVKPTKETAPEVWEAIPQRFREMPPGPGVAVELPSGDFLVGDKLGSFVYRLNSKGETESYILNFQYGPPDALVPERFNAPSMLQMLPNGDVLAALPLSKCVIRLDPETMVAKWVAGRASNFLGNFLAISGMAIIPTRPDQLLVTDNTLNTLQVFNMETGEYMYNFGKPEKKPDPELSGLRPTFEFAAPRLPVFTLDGKKIYFNAGALGFIYDFDLEPLPTGKPAP